MTKRAPCKVRSLVSVFGSALLAALKGLAILHFGRPLLAELIFPVEAQKATQRAIEGKQPGLLCRQGEWGFTRQLPKHRSSNVESKLPRFP